MDMFGPLDRRRTHRSAARALLAACLGLLAWLGPLAGLALAQPPTLIFEAPEQLDRQVEMLESFDLESLRAIQELVGLESPGPPIHVLLAEEGSPPTKIVPSWAVAYAFGSTGRIVLMPSRIPAYPDDDLEEVLRHEVAHVLISRAGGRNRLPRWFDEGLAVHAARPWGLDDRARVMNEAIRGRRVSLEELNESFRAGGYSAGRAYALSGQVMRYLLDEHGDRTAARILRRVRRGMEFDAAFLEVTGFDLPRFETAFYRHLDFWQRWVPFFTSSAFLWILVTILAVAAAGRRRNQAREQREIWALEEAAAAAAARLAADSALSAPEFLTGEAALETGTMPASSPELTSDPELEGAPNGILPGGLSPASSTELPDSGRLVSTSTPPPSGWVH